MRTRRSSLLAAGASAVLQGAALAVFAMLSRMLSKPDLGAYRQVLVLQSIGSILVAAGMPTAMLYALGRAPRSDERAAIYRAGLIWIVASTVLSGLLSEALVVAAGAYFRNPTLSATAPMAGLSGAVMLASLFIGPVLLSRGAADKFLLFAATQMTFTLVVTWLWVRVHPNVDAALGASALSGALGLIVVLVIIGRLSSGADWKTSIDRLSHALRYGGPVAASSALYTLSYQVDHFVALALLHPAAYALYAGGAWQLPIGPLVQRAQADVLLPVLSAHHSGGRRAEFWSEWSRLVVPWASVGAALFWGIFPAADDLVRVVLGQQFAASANVLRVYTLILPLRMAAFTLPLRAAGLTMLDVFACIAFGVASLLVGKVATPSLGLTGPAVGVVIGYSVWVGINLVGTARILKTPMTVVLPLRQVAATMMTAGVAALPAWLVSHALIDHAGFQRFAVYGVMYAGTLGSLFFVVLRRQTTAVGEPG